MTTAILLLAAHLAQRDALDLAGLLGEVMGNPLAFTDGDRAVLQHRINALRTSLAPLMPVRVVTTNDGEAA